MQLGRLDADDQARLGMDTVENPMVITAVVRVEGALDAGTLLALVEDRILIHERLRSRIEHTGLLHRTPCWREADTDARDQVTRVVLAPLHASEGDLTELVSDLMAQPLDPERPPWHLWLVDCGNGGSVLVFRIHHAIADGIGLLHLLFGFSDEGEGTILPQARSTPPSTDRGRIKRAAALARLMFRRSDPPCLAGALSGYKRIAWTAPIDLEKLHRAAHAADAHINDVLLGILAGALRDLIVLDGDVPDVLHALVPVSLGHDAHALGNHFVSVFVPLPVGLTSATARVHAARDAMREARAQSGVPLGRTLVAGASLAGRHAEQAAVRVLSRKASLVATDLAGPPIPLHVAGHLITEVVFAAPAPGSVGLSASAFSYAGQLRVTIASDAAVIREPTRLTSLVEAHADATIAALLASEPTR